METQQILYSIDNFQQKMNTSFFGQDDWYTFSQKYEPSQLREKFCSLFASDLFKLQLQEWGRDVTNISGTDQNPQLITNRIAIKITETTFSLFFSKAKPKERLCGIMNSWKRRCS